jgi:Na+-transporting NADH:ubiquinone oxidoreductase subunit NqrB
MPRVDPRLSQIAVRGSLLAAGAGPLGFDVTLPQIAVTLVVALGVQAAAARAAGRPDPAWSSALISALSLCLLLRTNDVRFAGLAAVIAIGSKFALRVGAKHVFIPTNVAIVALLAGGAPVWVSPGQWGDAAILAFLLASAGMVVATRASRADVSLAFLACYVGLMLARTAWLGDPVRIPLHRLQNGSLLLFTFFMISDPKTTPDSRAARLIFGAAVALGAYYVHFVLFRTNGLLWSLAACSPLVPLLDRLLPGARYTWPGSPAASLEKTRYETLAGAAVRPGPRAVVN